jgi:ABC-type transport system substrate-binding protein
MKLLYSASIVASLLLSATFSPAATRPHYGGTLRLQSRDMVATLENVWQSPITVLQQQLTYLLFDRLTRVDDAGNSQTSLAMSWTKDPQQRVWEFQVRSSATFSDGSPVTARDIASSISKAAPQWKVSASGQTVTIEAETPTPHLAELVALPEFSVTKLDSDQKAMGSGVFRIDTFQPTRRIVLAANDDYWGGRPYLDKVEITLGGSVREELINRRLDLDDVVDLSLDQARTIGYGAQHNPALLPNQRLAISQPADLYALLFFRAGEDRSSTNQTNHLTDDARIREAIALTLDRDAISRVLLQKEGEAASSLLPQWMTGYSFLFDAPPDVDRARKLRNEAVRSGPVSILLAYDAGDNVARAIAERIAVNAREANITLQVFGEKNLMIASAANTGAEVMLVRLPLADGSPTAALWDLVKRAEAGHAAISQIESVSGAESALSAERSALEGFQLVPIVDVPQIYWLNVRVRDWTTGPSGGWHLQDTWVESERPAASPTAILR